MTADVLAFNGVDGRTGDYLYDRLALDELEQRIGRAPDDAHAKELQYLRAAGEPHFGLAHRLDAESLADAGWGVAFAAGTRKAMSEALWPLLERRRIEAGDRYHEFEIAPDMSKQAFLAAHGIGPGVANPRKVPYYLLVVGSPDEIPYRFQYELDAQYAVGRLSFDSAQEYRSYADAVVAAEGETALDRRSMRLFGPSQPADRASTLSATQLVAPLAEKLAADAPAWDVASIMGADATKERLTALLFDDGAPDVLFTAGHGIGFKASDPRRREAQGALVTQDWAGPGLGISELQYLAGADVQSDRRVRARIVLSFACFGAGTPATSDLPAFVARLPQRLLGSPAGGALAYVGHVDRALGYSFVWPDAGAQREHFSSALLALVDGWRIGHAMEYFDARYMDVTVTLIEILDRIHGWGKVVDPVELAALWTASHDARNYIVLGDPAVRLPGPPSELP